MYKKKDYKINRILSIYQRLIKGDILNKEQLALEFGVSDKSIQRDIENLKNYLGEQPNGTKLIKYSRSLKGYVLEETKDSQFSRENILALIKVILGTRAFNQK